MRCLNGKEAEKDSLLLEMWDRRLDETRLLAENSSLENFNLEQPVVASDSRIFMDLGMATTTAGVGGI
jgi:hypothetical protein